MYQYHVSQSDRLAVYKRRMVRARILRLFIGTKLAARVFGFRAHWVRDAKVCGYSWI